MLIRYYSNGGKYILSFNDYFQKLFFFKNRFQFRMFELKISIISFAIRHPLSKFLDRKNTFLHASTCNVRLLLGPLSKIFNFYFKLPILFSELPRLVRDEFPYSTPRIIRSILFIFQRYSRT